jgi:hypothetical protein
MNQEKYIGMDVHQATISVAVMEGRGKLIMECILETKAGTILEFIQGLHGSLSVTFEEGTSAAWLHDLLKPHVAYLVVCDPRKNALLKDGSKSDRIDARKLADLLRLNRLNPVYHGEHGVRTLKELGRSYLTITQDLTRVMNRIKALYRSWAIPCSGTTVYAPDSGEYRMVRGKLRRNRERLTVLGLNDNHNHDLKNLFKGAAISASTRPGPLYDFYVGLLAKGMRPTMARLTLARKIATITLTMWKKGVGFDANELQRQAA